jgi:hypothetical protein
MIYSLQTMIITLIYYFLQSKRLLKPKNYFLNLHSYLQCHCHQKLCISLPVKPKKLLRQVLIYSLGTDCFFLIRSSTIWPICHGTCASGHDHVMDPGGSLYLGGSKGIQPGITTYISSLLSIGVILLQYAQPYNISIHYTCNPP